MVNNNLLETLPSTLGEFCKQLLELYINGNFALKRIPISLGQVPSLRRLRCDEAHLFTDKYAVYEEEVGTQGIREFFTFLRSLPDLDIIAMGGHGKAKLPKRV